MKNNQKIRICLKSFDHRPLENATREVVWAIKRTGAEVVGPIPFPRRIERLTVNRSPHVNKKSREQFEIRKQKRLVIIHYPTPQTVDAFKGVALPAGVDIEVKLESIE